jgi:hypothetical protein
MKDALVICALFNIIDRMADAIDVATAWLMRSM